MTSAISVNRYSLSRLVATSHSILKYLALPKTWKTTLYRIKDDTLL